MVELEGVQEAQAVEKGAGKTESEQKDVKAIKVDEDAQKLPEAELKEEKIENEAETCEKAQISAKDCEPQPENAQNPQTGNRNEKIAKPAEKKPARPLFRLAPTASLNSDWLLEFRENTAQSRVEATVPMLPVLAFADLEKLHHPADAPGPNETFELVRRRMALQRDSAFLRELYAETGDGSLTQVVPNTASGRALKRLIEDQQTI